MQRRRILPLSELSGTERHIRRFQRADLDAAVLGMPSIRAKELERHRPNNPVSILTANGLATDAMIC